MKNAFGDLQNGTVYRSDLFQCRKLNISKFAHRLEIQASGSLERGTWSRSLLLFKKSLWLITTGLLCLRVRPASDARAAFVLPEYLKIALSKSVMRNVARFRIRGCGLKCETGLYGRSRVRQECTCLRFV